MITLREKQVLAGELNIPIKKRIEKHNTEMRQ